MNPEKPRYVLWKWDSEVYEIIGETPFYYTIKNIKYGQITTVEIKEVIEIQNM